MPLLGHAFHRSIGRVSRAWFPLVALSSILFAISAQAQEATLNAQQLADLSLEELMDVSIQSPAALTHLDSGEAPASVTSLTEEEIRRSPARNLYDLIEVFVPGSVTYSPGAVAGVIRITTHDARSLPGTRVTGRYFYQYGSIGGVLSHSLTLGGTQLRAYGSMTRTVGHEPLAYHGSNDNHPGYIGQDVRLNADPLDYFADYQDIPQAKVHLDATYPGCCSTWKDGWKPFDRVTPITRKTSSTISARRSTWPR